MSLSFCFESPATNPPFLLSRKAFFIEAGWGVAECSMLYLVIAWPTRDFNLFVVESHEKRFTRTNCALLYVWYSKLSLQRSCVVRKWALL